jgi:hypothetical protein
VQQALLYNEKIVQFYQCKSCRVYLFYRRNNTVYAWVKHHQPSWSASSVLFEILGVLVLYDPPEKGATFSTGCRQLIVAMCPDEKHDLLTHDTKQGLRAFTLECLPMMRYK